MLKWLLMATSVMIAAYLVPGVMIKSFFSALFAALFLGIINTLIRPVLILITLPINIITLGLFTFVINAILVLLTSSIIKGFEVSGFWTAMLFSVILSIVNYVLNGFFRSLRRD